MMSATTTMTTISPVDMGPPLRLRGRAPRLPGPWSRAHVAPDFDLQSHSVESDGALPPADVVARGRGVRNRTHGADRPRHGRRRAGRRWPPRASTACAARPPPSSRASRASSRTCTSAATSCATTTPSCARRSPTSAPTAGGGSGRWPTGWRSSASRSTARELRARERAGPPLGRPHLADAVLAHPANAPKLRAEGIDGKNTLFPPYLVPGAVAYVARSRPTVEEAIDVIHARGRRRRLGAPVLGHRRPRDGARGDRPLRRGRAGRRRGLLRRPTTRSRRACSTTRRASAGCSRPARPTSTAPARAVQPLRGVRAVRAGAGARPDRRLAGARAQDQPREPDPDREQRDAHRDPGDAERGQRAREVERQLDREAEREQRDPDPARAAVVADRVGSLRQLMSPPRSVATITPSSGQRTRIEIR